MATIHSTESTNSISNIRLTLNEPEEINPHIHLSATDSQLFADLMEADDEPNEQLRQAALDYQQMMRQKRS